MTVTVITPATDPSALNAVLRRLTRAIQIARPDLAESLGFGLGGADGYGVPIETDAFVMRLHDENPPCTCGVDAREREAWLLWDASGEIGDPPPILDHALTCPTSWPNFHHKPSGFMVWWHKWIGRSMETQGPAPDLEAMYAECVRSLGGPS